MHRWVTQVRGNLVSLIYNKSLTLKYAGSGDKAAISLMSTDIERISMGLPALHEIGASVIETAIAIWLLERQVSYAAVACAGLVLLCTALSSRIGPPAGVRAGVWAGMIQSRVAATNDYLQNIRSFRMAGLGASAAEYLQELRVTEVAAAMVCITQTTQFSA
jgi:ATP-binding cassette, subfamily C (CFTR/MRP), member 1